MIIQLEANTLWLSAVVFLLLVLVLAALGVLFWNILRRGRSPAHDRREIQQRWGRIEALLAEENESASRHAVIEADAVVDLALKLKFFSGKDFAGRLRTGQRRYARLRSVWSAHALRNRLVHESGTVLTAAEARRAVALFRNGLKEIGML